MAKIDRYLKMVWEAEGSDLHLAADVVPKIRVHGKLRPLKQEPLTNLRNLRRAGVDI